MAPYCRRTDRPIDREVGILNHETTVQIVSRLLAHIDNKTTDYASAIMRMPIERYFDSSIAASERERIFTRLPFVACHASQIPNVGDFMTIEYVGIPILMARREDKSISALINVCRHRGARVELASCGNRKEFICSYHGWRYGQDGTLTKVSFPEGYPSIGPSESSLPSLPVEERHGLVWVTPVPGAELDMAAYLGTDMDAGIDASGIGAATLCREERWELGMNWKLVMDGFLDTQHIGFLHPQTVGPSFYPNIHVLDAFDRHTRLVVARRSLLEIRGTDASEDELKKHLGCNYNVYPATIIVVVPTHFEVLTISPHVSDVAKCDVTLRFLAKDVSLPETEQQARDSNWSTYLDALTNEDWPTAKGIGDSLPHGHMAETLYGRNDLPAQAYYGQIQRDLDASC
jgi:phenylpropionate dioxygenase-like ring-hydroxylating dioxygenase large terminal subunit